MTRRWRVLRGGPEDGSALAVALVFMMLFAIWIGSVLQFAAADQRVGIAAADGAAATYTGGGAIDAAINAIRGTLTTGTAAAGTTTCFTLPAGALDNGATVSVTCDPTPTSGATTSSSSQPDAAVTAVSPTAGEGVNVSSGTTSVRGGVSVNKTLTVASGATLDSTGHPVRAGSCPGVSGGTVKDSCATFAGVGDPNYADPSTALAAQPALPACGATVTLQPGIYRSVAALQAVLNCSNARIVLSTGTYFFDFIDSGAHEVVFDGGPRNSALLGGAVAGGSCVQTSPGVELVFGGDSRMTVQSGKVDLCSLLPSTDTTAQHVVLRGLKSALTVPTKSTAAGVSATSVGTTAWSSPNSGAVIDTVLTTTTLSTTNSAQNAVLRVALPAVTVPSDASNISATVTVRERINTTNTTTTSTAALRTPAGTVIATKTLLACTTSTTCAGVLKDDTTASFTGLTAAQLNGSPTPATIDVRVSKSSGTGSVTSGIDGLSVALSYDLPIRRACTLSSPAGACVAGTVPPGPLLLAKGTYATTPLALHGTVYAPTSSLDLQLTSVSATVVDRGIVVRHLLLSMTPAAGAPPLVSVPVQLGQPRVIVLVATDSNGTVLARARVTFADGSGTVNGSVPTVHEWSVT